MVMLLRSDIDTGAAELLNIRISRNDVEKRPPLNKRDKKRENNTVENLDSKIPNELRNRPTFERLLLPEYISNDILQYLVE